MKKVIQGALLVVGILLIALLGYSYLPLPIDSRTMDITLIQDGFAQGELPADLPQFLYDQKMTLTLSLPGQMWLGDQQFVALVIKPAEVKSTTGVINSNSRPYHVNIETRLDLENGRILPGKTIIEPIQAGKSVRFLWQMKAESSGRLEGKLWLYINILQPTSGSSWRLTRFALPVQIEVKELLGLPLDVFRTMVWFVLILILTGLIMLAFWGRKVR